MLFVIPPCLSMSLVLSCDGGGQFYYALPFTLLLPARRVVAPFCTPRTHATRRARTPRLRAHFVRAHTACLLPCGFIVVQFSQSSSSSHWTCWWDGSSPTVDYARRCSIRYRSSRGFIGLWMGLRAAQRTRSLPRARTFCTRVLSRTTPSYTFYASGARARFCALHCATAFPTRTHRTPPRAPLRTFCGTVRAYAPRARVLARTYAFPTTTHTPPTTRIASRAAPRVVLARMRGYCHWRARSAPHARTRSLRTHTLPFPAPPRTSTPSRALRAHCTHTATLHTHTHHAHLFSFSAFGMILPHQLHALSSFQLFGCG